MASKNKVNIMGRLGADPTIRYSDSGNAITSFNVATDSKYKNKAGDWVEETEWHRVVCFGKRAETMAEYLHKGSFVDIEGRLKTRTWEDKNGSTQYTTEIHITDLQFLDPKPKGASSEPPINNEAFDDSDVPF